MNWRDAWNTLFVKSSETERKPTTSQLGEGSVAWSNESYLRGDGVKYNPDDLIGRKGFGIYNRMMFDEQVKAVMHFKRSTVTGREWYFELDHKEKGLSQKDAEHRVDVCNTMLSTGYSGPIIDGFNAIMKAMWQGYSMTEQVFGQFECADKTYWGIRELKAKPFDTFFPHVDDKGTVLYWTQRGGTGFAEKKIDIEKFVYYRFNPDMDEHYGWSDLRAAYRAYLSKDITIRYRNIFMERLAGGFVVAKPMDGSVLTRGSPEWNALTAILSNITGKSSIILPAGIELEIMYATGGQVGVFKESTEADDIAIARSALVPNLIGMTPSGQTGSYSQSDTQFDVFMIISDLEAERLASALNEQVFQPLGRVNFADGITPKFCFKPLSKRRAQQVLMLWSTMVSGKTVQASETDEAHIRKLLEFPEKGELLIDPAAPAPTTTPTSTSPGKEGDDGEQEPTGTGDKPAPVGKGKTSDEDRDKRKEYRRAAFSRAEQRVAFSVIGRQSDAETARHVVQLEDAVAEAVMEGLTRVGDPRANADAARNFDLDAMKTRHVETWVRRALKVGMDIGANHAGREVDRAKGTGFSRTLNFARLGDLAAEWMKNKSFTIAGDVKAGVVREIKQSMISGLKMSLSEKEIKNDIYRRLVKKGFLGGRTAAEALGAGDTATLRDLLAVKGDLEPHRLNTVIRTNMFEAINEARFNTFTDPALEGFVKGLEYSSVLDGRTSEICEHMDGRTYAPDVWEDELRPWVPPNHFNCRSILVPVTEADEVDLETEVPDIEPQEGFG